MSAFFARYATPFTTGFFIISLVSGLALFFHLGTAYFREMHEILSLVLVLPFVLHVWKNWRAFLTYFKRPPMAIALGLSLAAALAFAAPAMMSTQSGGVSPQMAVFQMIENGKVEAIAGLIGTTPDVLSAKLGEAGFPVTTPQQTLADVAESAGKSVRDILPVVTALRQ